LFHQLGGEMRAIAKVLEEPLVVEECAADEHVAHQRIG